MTENMVHLTSRVPRDLLDKLEELAKQRRMQTGESISRADLVREALEALADGGAPTPAGPGMDDPDPYDFGVMVMDALEELADEAERQGIEDDPQCFGMAIWPAAKDDPRLERLLAIASKVHGALRAV
ncbi:hypothetical protein GCM10009578_021630 [Streptomyces rhizosphaericus]|uniref:ribbon-helix-helix domain-containing protein n=1 Tax=Streptomyces rhizosphaericus TaxID=114699 RepID=UPI0031D56EAB